MQHVNYASVGQGFVYLAMLGLSYATMLDACRGLPWYITTDIPDKRRMFLLIMQEAMMALILFIAIIMLEPVFESKKPPHFVNYIMLWSIVIIGRVVIKRRHKETLLEDTKPIPLDDGVDVEMNEAPHV
jgi:hypothetical protein